MTIRCSIPGEPHAQARGRAVRVGAHVRVVDPSESRSWKGSAQVHLLAARDAAGHAEPLTGPLSVRILAVFACPRSDYRKTAPRTRRLYTGRKDADNIAKAVMDAGNGTVWLDDRQVALLEVRAIVGAQGEAPCVVVRIDPMADAQPEPWAAVEL